MLLRSVLPERSANAHRQIHSARHCIGLAFYGALAVAYDRIGTDATWEQIELCASEECSKMEAALREIAVENEANPAQIDWKC